MQNKRLPQAYQKMKAHLFNHVTDFNKRKSLQSFGGRYRLRMSVPYGTLSYLI